MTALLPGQCGDLEILAQWQTHADTELPHGRHRYPEQYQVNWELSVPIIGQKVNNKNIPHCWQQLRWSARLWISPIDCGQTLRLAASLCQYLIWLVYLWKLIEFIDKMQRNWDVKLRHGLLRMEDGRVVWRCHYCNLTFVYKYITTLKLHTVCSISGPTAWWCWCLGTRPQEPTDARSVWRSHSTLSAARRMSPLWVGESDFSCIDEMQ